MNDLIEKFRVGEPVMISLTPTQKIKIMREIRIRNLVEAEEDRRELKRRLREF